MTWISLICLLALTSSAFGRYAYGGSDIASQTPLLSAGWGQQMIPRTILPTNAMHSQSYGQAVLPTIQSQPVVMHTPTVHALSYQQQQPIQQSFAAHMTLPKTLSVQNYAPAGQVGYGAAPVPRQLEQPVLTEADILCKGHQAEEVIPIDNNRKFVVCLDNGKGVEQQCPTGLFYHPTSQRCERTAGPLEDACSSQPCLNNGQCFSSGSSFQCQCAPGYEGVVCELDARVCQTQQPCGTSPDVKCQSFRAGAALQYVCIFQKGLGYGLNPQQIIPSPCQGVEGPQALAVSQNGFLMCDGNQMFVESCPGGTIWDDVEKACSWPDQQAAPQAPQAPTTAYGYGNQVIPQQQIQMVIPKQLGSWTQSYGAQVPVPQQQQPIQSYGAQVTLPQQLPKMIAAKQFLQPTQSYGAQVTLSQQLPKLLAAKQFLQPTQSYGAQISIPQQQQQQQPTQSGVAQISIPQQQPTQSYGAQVSMPQQPTQSGGAQISMPQQQPTQSVDAQISMPQQQQSTQSYDAQISIPQQQPQQQQQQPAIIAPKQLTQSSQGYGSALFSSY